MGLIELGAIWPPKPGQNMAGSGKVSTPLDAEAAQARNDILRRIAQGECPRIVMFENDPGGNPRAPRWRILFDDGVDALPQQHRGAGARPGGEYGGGGGYQQPPPAPAPPPPPSGHPQDDIPW